MLQAVQPALPLHECLPRRGFEKKMNWIVLPQWLYEHDPLALLSVILACLSFFIPSGPQGQVRSFIWCLSRETAVHAHTEALAVWD